MNTIGISFPFVVPSSGELVAVDVVKTAFLAADFGEGRYEWIEGAVIRMGPTTRRHTLLVGLLREFLRAYMSLRPLGQVYAESYYMALTLPDREVLRLPDIMVVRNDNPHSAEDAAFQGAADICIEVVSKSSVHVDYREKRIEYEQGGVREYWIIDDLKHSARFFRLGEAGSYVEIPAGDDYTTPILPGFCLPIDRLWQAELPDLATVLDLVRQMLSDREEE